MENLYGLSSVEADSQNCLFLHTHWVVYGKKNLEEKWKRHNFKPIWVKFIIVEYTLDGEPIKEYTLKELGLS